MQSGISALSTELPRGIYSPLWELPLNDIPCWLDQLACSFSERLLIEVLGLCGALPCNRYTQVLEWAYIFFDDR